MNIEQMKYIVEVAKEKSITKAAEKLHLSPSAISQSISQLEDELGIAIFIRSKKGMTPTSDGKIILSKSYEVLYKIQELHDELASQKSHNSNLLKVACTPAMTYVVYDAFLSFNKDYKDVKVIIEELNQDIILKEIKNENIDIAFASFSNDELNAKTHEYGIGFDLIYKAYVCAFVNSQSHLARFHSVTPEDLKNEKVVMYNSNFVKSLYDKHLINKDIFVISNNIEVLRTAVIHGHAFTLAFDFIFKNNSNLRDGNLVMIPFKNPDIIYQDFWCLHSLTKGLSNTAKKFEKKLIDLLVD
jgi:LysR family transcriptional regulator, transcription activator of glutamate synthase operon